MTLLTLSPIEYITFPFLTYYIYISPFISLTFYSNPFYSNYLKYSNHLLNLTISSISYSLLLWLTIYIQSQNTSHSYKYHNPHSSLHILNLSLYILNSSFILFLTKFYMFDIIPFYSLFIMIFLMNLPFLILVVTWVLVLPLTLLLKYDRLL